MADPTLREAVRRAAQGDPSSWEVLARAPERYGAEGALALLEAVGVAWAVVPAGTYPVGDDGAGEAKLLARPPRWDHVPPQATPTGRFETPGYRIAREPLRLSQAELLVELGVAPDALTEQALARTRQRVVTADEVTVPPTAGDAQMGERDPRTYAQQVDLDPPLILTPEEARAASAVLGLSLPSWREWEAAVRGPEGLRTPWGDALELGRMSLQTDDYSIDDESVMGYYCYDQTATFVRSFGPYASTPSPCGLLGLGRPGHEWNLADAELAVDDPLVLRSLADLGCMLAMVPGYRRNTVGGGSWQQNAWRAFSGPIAACYAPAHVSERIASSYGKPFGRAAVRWVAPLS